MAVTAAGTPYVESSDNVADYPGVSLALANHIDSLDGGKVLQVVSVTKVDTFTTTSASYIDITGLTATITPSATSSKILVIFNVSINNANGQIGIVQLLRGSTVIGGGTAVGSRGSAFASQFTNTSEGTGSIGGTFLDSPATTSAETYKIQARVSAGTMRVNTTASDGDTSTQPRTSSTITLMEISA